MRALLSALLLASCARGEDASADAPDTNQIERLATPQAEEPDPQASARLQPLGATAVTDPASGDSWCTFGSGGDTLLMAVGSDSMVRLNGQVIHLVHSSPMGPSGGFFEDRQISVSVGRVSPEGSEAAAATTWPARATVTNRRTKAQVELTGTWTCGA